MWSSDALPQYLTVQTNKWTNNLQLIHTGLLTGSKAAGLGSPSLGILVPPCAGSRNSPWIKEFVQNSEGKKGEEKPSLEQSCIKSFGDLSSWYKLASLPTSRCRVESFYERAGGLQRATSAGLPWAQTATLSHTSAVTMHRELQLADASSVLGTGNSFQGETQCHLRQQNFAEYYWYPLWSLVCNR